MSKSALNRSVSMALLGGTVLMTASSRIVATEIDCGFDDCEAPAPYTLKIITHGEGAPRAANDSVAGMQQNRRVDVSVSRRVKVKNRNTVTDLPALAAAKLDGSSGRFWVSQNPTVLDQLLGLKVPASSVVANGSLQNPIKMSIVTNYAEFIERWELRILSDGGASDSEPLHVLHGTLEGTNTEVEWNGKFAANELIDTVVKEGESYAISLRVYDRQGNFDQTVASSIKLVSNSSASGIANDVEGVAELSIKSLSDEPGQFRSEFAQQSISVSGSTVTVRGQDIRDVKSVAVNGEKVSLVNGESFAVQYILPPGDHEFDIKAQQQSGDELSETLTVDVKPGYFFMVGIADITVGENRVTGSIEPLAVDDHQYGGDLFVDGRLAFYLKGKVKGKYLLTAQMDTGNEDISELFNDFHRKDAGSVFRRIDPDQYYLVYGDDSAIVDDTNSQGKVYLRVDWDKSHALWGNFNTAFSGTEFAPFNRSLYGAQYRHRSLATTAQGDTKTEVSAFMSEAQTIFRHNEFSGTGGSLYYLRDQDIVLGSEKLWVEVRRNGSEQVVQRIPLERGRDYEIDEFQGRIILNRPLLSVSSQTGPSIIRNEPQLGDNTFLIVDYEYVPSDFVNGGAATGARGKRWLNNHIAVGGTWAHENRDSDDYDVKAVDVTVKKSDNTYIRFEVAHSESSQTSGSFLSDDGGLTFSAFNSNADSSAGDAMGVEARVSANDIINIEKPLTIAAWAKRREAGFSTASLDTGVDTTDTGVEVVAEVSDKLSLSGRATRLNKREQSRESVIAVQADYKASQIMTVSGEIRRVEDKVLQSTAGGAGTAASSESALLAAGKVSLQLNDSVSAYGIAQGALGRSGNYDNNKLLTAGAKAKIDDSLSVNGEISSGDRGTNIMLGAEREVSDTYSVYGNVNVFNDTNSALEQSVTLGQRKSLSDTLKVYTEHQFSSEEKSTGVTNTLGITNTFNRYTTGTLSFQSSRLEDEFDVMTERDTLSAGLSFKRDYSHLTSKLEFRQDKSDTLDTDQWVMTNNLEYRLSSSTRWQGRLNLSSTDDNLSGDDARFVEAGVGFAHRPVVHDRLNLLGRYTYLYDLPPLSQSDKSARRSSIYSFESIYELGKRWSVGGKLAHREGEIQTRRDGGGWVGNDATLTALRLRYKAPLGIDAMGSYHWLSSDSTDGMRQGALLSLGYTVGKHLQFSVGYNFTSFDDNLANDDYDVRGWFFNLVGKY